MISPHPQRHCVIRCRSGYRSREIVRTSWGLSGAGTGYFILTSPCACLQGPSSNQPPLRRYTSKFIPKHVAVVLKRVKTKMRAGTTIGKIPCCFIRRDILRTNRELNEARHLNLEAVSVEVTYVCTAASAREDPPIWRTYALFSHQFSL